MSRATRWVIAAWLAVAGVTLAFAPRAIGHDQASLLESGIRIAHGAVEFRDLLDINSPVAHYVHAVPAAVAAITATNAIPWFIAFVALLSAWSAFLGDGALVALSPRAHWTERTAAMLVPLGPGTLHVAFAEPGQREHLFVILYFPFLMYRVAAAHGVPVGTTLGRFTLGAIAAVGVGIKPHFLLPVILAEAAILLAGRKPRLLLAPEVAGALATALVCVTGLILLPADARSILTDQILPSVLRGYGAYDAPDAVLARRAIVRLAALVVAGALALRCGPASLRPATAPLIAFCAGAIGAATLQRKGFGYHYLPADAASIYLAASAVLGLVERGVLARAKPAAGAAMIAFMLVWRPLSAATAARPDAYPFRTVLEQYTRPGDGVIVMSTSSVYVAPAALQTDRVNLARQSPLLLILAMTADASGGGGVARQSQVLREMAEEIGSHRAAAVFFDRHEPCQGCPPGFNVARRLQADPEIQRALADYRYAGVAQDFDVFVRR